MTSARRASDPVSGARPRDLRAGIATWCLWAVALAGLLYLVGLTAWLGVAGLVYPYQLDYGEGYLVHFVRQWAAGNPIYLPLGQYPFISCNYAPLMLVMALAVSPLTGLTYAAGRLWVLLSVAVLGGLLARWVWHAAGPERPRRWLPALAAALFFVGSPYVYHWVPLFRIDLPGLALSLGGLTVVHSQLRSPRRGGWTLVVILFVAGLYTKQSFLFAPAAALAYLFFWSGQGKAGRWLAIKLAVAIGGLGSGLFLIINALTGGGFWQALVVSNVNPFLWSEFWAQQAAFWRTFALLALLATWYLVDKFLRAREPVALQDAYLATALLSLLLAGKAGSWENYFFEALLALSLCAGLGLSRLDSDRRRWLRLLAPLLVIAQVVLMWHTPQVAQRYLNLTRRSNEAIAPLLAQTPDPIFSEDAGLLVQNGKTLDYWPFQYSQLARAGRHDQAWELDRLRQRVANLVILEQGTRLDVDHYQRFTRQFVSELDRNYRQAATLGKYVVYEPDPLQHERRVPFSDQLALVGWSVDAPLEPGSGYVAPGATMTLTVVWQAQQALAVDYTAFAHLVDATGQGWAGDDHMPYQGLYPTSAWGDGEMVRDTFVLTVPHDAPPGLYDLVVGWYGPDQDRLSAAGPGDSQTSTRVAVLPVGQPATSSWTLNPLAYQFGERIGLEGAAWRIAAGKVDIALRWRAAAPMDTGYTVFVHLVDGATGSLAAQGDGPPMGGRWPTWLWIPGVPLDDLHTIPLEAGLAPGDYTLQVGLYDPDSGTRLSLPDARDAVTLGTVTVP